MICVDANIVIALLSSADEWNDVAMSEFVRSDGFKVLTVTRAEAMVRTYRTGQVEVANQLLTEYEIETIDVSIDIADRAAALRAVHGNRHFPIVDALVVALGLETGLEVLTTNDKWPAIPDAKIRVLTK